MPFKRCYLTQRPGSRVPKHLRQRAPEPIGNGACAASNCDRRAPENALMCPACWATVPYETRQRVAEFQKQLQSSTGKSHELQEKYRRACVKALAQFEQTRATPVDAAIVLESAKTRALRALAQDGDFAVPFAWWGFVGVLQQHRINPARLGVALRRYNEGQLRGADELRAELEAF